jgi:exopolysaccharide biosynthesis polyprenyl glycosylphosphotransferase
MYTFKRQLLLKAYKLYDFGVFVFAFVLAATTNAILASENVSVESFFSMRIKLSNLLILCFIFLAWQILFSALGIHHSRRLEKKEQEFLDILKLTTIATFILLGFSVLCNIRLIDNLFLVNFWSISSLFLILSRIALRLMLKTTRLYGRNLRHMVIIGTGNRAQKFADIIKQKPELGYHIIGFVDDEWKGLQNNVQCRNKLLAGLDCFQQFLRDKAIDEVVIALPVKSYYDTISNIIKACEEQGIVVRFLSDLFNQKLAKSQSSYLEDIPLVTLSSRHVESRALFIKRFIDIVLSGIILLFLSPVFLAIALLIRLDFKGPIFFIQDRVGYNKRRFKLFKFRSMVQGAELRQDELEEMNEASGPVFKIKDDPRLTRIGKWLRRTSIDELPQLINVLKGDMSLVGPRPLPVRDYIGFDHDWHRRRFSVRPGITCLWQVNGRSALPFDKWMKLDMEYIDNWSLWMDLKILFKTIPAIVKGSGAA